MKILPSKPLDYRLEYSRSLKQESYRSVGREYYIVEPLMDYETIFKVSFSLEATQVQEMDVYMLQSYPESRRILRGTEGDESEGPSLFAYFMFKMLHLCSYAGCLWFVLTRVIFGPLAAFLAPSKPEADLEDGSVKDQRLGLAMKID
mmetsp:Transcript_36078/g.55395  ORF Transcript_36078/g.55395 Transcript_36078/m.55395 type:complete len:147 (+) Transcript_36078:1949-2389(+)